MILGWSGFGVVSFVALSVYFKVEGPMPLVFYESTRIAMAFGLTLLLHPLYRRLWARGTSFPILGLASLAGSLACGVGLLGVPSTSASSTGAP